MMGPPENFDEFFVLAFLWGFVAFMSMGAVAAIVFESTEWLQNYTPTRGFWAFFVIIWLVLTLLLMYWPRT